METLQQGYIVKKSAHNRQFQAVLVKDIMQTLVQPCAIIFCLIVTGALAGLMGGLHIYYVNNHTTVDTSSSASTPVNMPMEGSPSNINHRIQFTLPSDTSKTLQQHFGELPENSTGSGYLAAADKQFDNNNGPQTRAQIIISNATYDVDGTLQIPFSDSATSMAHLWCDGNVSENCTINFDGYDAFDNYENTTAYNLMYEDIDAQDDETGQATQQFLYRKHKDLYTAGVNYTYFSSAYNKLGVQPEDIGWNYVISTYTSHQTQLGYNLTNFFHVGGTQYWLWHIFLRNNFQAQNSNVPLVQGQYKYFWQNYDDEGTDPYTPIYSCLFIPLAFYIVIALLSYNMSAEKAEGQQAIQQMMGLRFWYRYFGDLVFNLIISAIVSLLIFIILIACSTEYITSIYPLITFFWIMLFLLYIPILSHLFAAFTDSPRAVSIISLLYVVVISVVALVAFAGPLFDTSVTNRYVDYAYALIPGMAPIVMLIDIAALVTLQDPNYYLSTSNSYYFSLSKNADNSILANTGYQCACACFIGYLMVLVYGLIAIYVDKISPRKNGIPEHWLFMFQHLYEQSCYYNKERISELSNRKVGRAIATFFKHPSIVLINQQEIDQYITLNQESDAKNAAAESSEAPSTTDFQTTLSTQQLSSNVETSTTIQSSKLNTQVKEQKQFMKQGFHSNSPDLIKEKQNCLANITCTGGTPLINIINLQKTFKTRLGVKHAVRGLYYTVGENELLVLLGPNGCGKTTHINIISGLFRATSGNAFVCGQSILQSSSQKNFADRIGICPQFDIIYPKLTVMQHMQFYARMKGVNSEVQQQHIRELLYSVGLYKQMNQKAGTLSGGMKRRLSIAISLINKPKIVILDEPSSGLDVATRRAVWSIILRYKQDRAIILTTHAMEEAEALATRVGIMADGKLLAIDTVANLKNRFSSGYQLTVNCKQLKTQSGIQQEGKIQLTYEGEQIVNSLIKQAFNNQMTLVQCYQGNLTYLVSKQLKISKVFQIMEQMCSNESTNVADYALNQASLESVFMKVVKNSGEN